MKKTIIAGLFLPLLLLASCASEDVVAPTTGDGTVTFVAQLPGSMNRDYSDGLKATQLTYAVYDAATDECIIKSGDEGAPVVAFSERTATLSLNLVKGKKYNVIFWADKPGNSFYTFDADAKTITVDYSGIQMGDEDRDAFFQVEKNLAVTGTVTKTIELRRPFAQLNWGTDDKDKAEKAGVTVSKAEVKVSNVYKTLDLLNGIAKDATAMTFTKNVLPAESAFPGGGYDYLAMDYILTGIALEKADDVQHAQSEVLANCSMTLYDSSDKVINTINVSNVPVQRNYRTNIVGSLLTSSVDFTVIIMPDPFDSSNIEVKSEKPEEDADGNILVSTAAHLQYIRDAVNNGKDDYAGKTIILQNDINLNPQQVMAPIGSYIKNLPFAGTFDGNGKTIRGLNVVATEGDGSAAGLFGYMKGGVIKNLVLDSPKVTSNHFAGAAVALVHLSGGENPQNVIDNVTVKNATIISEPFANGDSYDGGNKVGGIFGYAAYGLHVTNCKVQNSYIQGYREVGGLAGQISNVNDDRTKYQNNTVSDCKIVQDLRHDYKAPSTPTTVGAIYGSLSSAAIDNTNKATNITFGALYDGLSQDGGDISVSNANGLAILPRIIDKIPRNKRGVVNIENDIDFTGKVWIPCKFNNTDQGEGPAFLTEINGNGHTISNLYVQGQAMFVNYAGVGLKIHDLNLDKPVVESTELNAAIFVAQTYKNILFENIHITGAKITTAYKCGTFVGSANSEGQGHTLTFKKCSVKNTTLIEKTFGAYGICGWVGFVFPENNDQVVFEGCSMDNVTMYYGENSYDLKAKIWFDATDDISHDEDPGVQVGTVNFVPLSSAELNEL